MINCLVVALMLCAASPELTFIKYFNENRTETGLVLDRNSNKTICSVACSGFDMDVQAISNPQTAIPKIRQTLKTIRTTNPKSNRGWLFHFIDPQGKPIPGTEVSTIDTAIFYAGALQASKRLKNKDLTEEVNQDIHKIDIKWMIENSPSRE